MKRIDETRTKKRGFAVNNFINNFKQKNVQIDKYKFLIDLNLADDLSMRSN